MSRKKSVHIYQVNDFSKLKSGTRYYSFCGKVFIACEPPTDEESAKIEADTKDSPVCRKCLSAFPFPFDPEKREAR